MKICDICGKEFKNGISLANHKRWHDLPEWQEYQNKSRERTHLLFKGRKQSEEHIQKKTVSGKDHGNWKGDKAGYHSIHQWVSKYKPKPEKCEDCEAYDIKLELSFNHSLGKHTRNIEDYKWICKSCHNRRDNLVLNFYGGF